MNPPQGRGAGHARALAMGAVAVVLWQVVRLAYGFGGRGWHPYEGAAPGVLLVACVVRFVPSAFIEEIVFRGVLLGGLGSVVPLPAALLTSLALFGGAHAYGGARLVLNSVVLGVIFTAAYLRTRSLGVTTLLHSLNNVVYTWLTTPG